MTRIFEEQGDFAALRAARDWCRAEGFSVGTLQADAPCGLLRGDFAISKWRNMNREERRALHGIIESVHLRGYREGPVGVTIYEEGRA